MKKLVLLLVLVGLFTGTKADEGMWLPMLVDRLNYADMKKMGLELTPEEIYSINNSSLKDAIVIFGGGCTGEMISSEGLLLTNHHCGYGNIQSHSSKEHDYLTDGFWAMSHEEELANPKLSVKFLVSIEDVTARINKKTAGAKDEADRNKILGETMKAIAAEAQEDNEYEAVVKEFFDGNAYYLFMYEVYTDVRLVGAPPSSIGKFGHDTDNWMWPRHTGDFALFRVYTSPDGKPAAYSKDNIPMKPKHHLPVNVSGVRPGDFSMILGNPGTTDRYLTSYGIELNLNHSYPTRIDIRRKKLDILGEDMQADAGIRIKYASKYARIANYWKNFIGMSKGLKELNVVQKKQQLENRLAAWIEADEERTNKYGDVLAGLKKNYADLAKYDALRYYQLEAIRLGSDALYTAAAFGGYVKTLKSDKSDEDKAAYAKRIDAYIAGVYKDYNMSTDIKILAAMLEMYSENVPADQQPEYLKKIAKKYKGDFMKYAEKAFKKSAFRSLESLQEAVNGMDAKVFEKDELFKLGDALYANYYKIMEAVGPINLELTKNKRLFMAALMEMDKDKSFYPNANFTMRLTYGQVMGYDPRDGVEYSYYTTMKGIMEKEDPNNYEFIVAPKLKELYESKDFGPYADGGEMRVCFLTNHDITGGNSGSPVVNSRGELIGLAFDGNWEAMSGDILFEPELQRTINVDIRYVLFVIEKFAGAKHLVDEMTLVKNPPAKPEKVEKTPDTVVRRADVEIKQ